VIQRGASGGIRKGPTGKNAKKCGGTEDCGACVTCEDVLGDDAGLACAWMITVAGTTTCIGEKMNISPTRYFRITSCPTINGTFLTNTVTDGCSRSYIVPGGVEYDLYDNTDAYLGSGTADLAINVQIERNDPQVSMFGGIAINNSTFGVATANDIFSTTSSGDECATTFDMVPFRLGGDTPPTACGDRVFTFGGTMTVTVTHA
jgi:hypothetical protein